MQWKSGHFAPQSLTFPQWQALGRQRTAHGGQPTAHGGPFRIGFPYPVGSNKVILQILSHRHVPSLFFINYPTTLLSNYPTINLPNYTTTRLPNYPTTQLSNYPTTLLTLKSVTCGGPVSVSLQWEYQSCRCLEVSFGTVTIWLQILTLKTTNINTFYKIICSNIKIRKTSTLISGKYLLH